jgi:predicted thioesterase
MHQTQVRIERKVEQSGLACNMKSGSLPVLATPQMIAWMEEAACLCLDLPSEKSSVGIEMNVSHDAPSPLGALIEIEAKISADLGKIIEFEVAAYMGDKCIGKGVHKRAIINIERFMGRVQG